MPSTSEILERLKRYVQACNYQNDLGSSSPGSVAEIIYLAYVGASGARLPEDDPRLFKLAAATVAYYRSLRKIALSGGDLDEIERVTYEKIAAGGGMRS